MTTPVLVQATNTSAVSATTVTATFTNPNTAGNFLIALGEIQNQAAVLTFSDPTNGNYRKLVSGGAGTQSLAIALFPLPTPAINNGGQGVTITMNSNVTANMRLTIHEWSGLDSTTPHFMLDQTLPIASGTSTTPSAGTFATLAEAGELVLVLAGTAGTSVTWTAGSGLTLDGTTNPSARQVEYQVVSDTTGPVGQFTISSSTAWVACGVALRSAKTRKVVSVTSGTTFSAPSDWPGIADRVDAIGGGGAGRAAASATHNGTGGGGAAYTYAYNVLINAGANVQIGAGGSTDGASGTDTWIVSSGTVLAKGGQGGGTGTSGNGGAAGSCLPAANAVSGGAGGNRGPASSTNGPCGGGGAGGPYGVGGQGGAQGVAGITGGSGGGGSGGGGAGANQSGSNQAGTNGGNANLFGNVVASTGGLGGASGINDGRVSTPINYQSGGGGGGGGSNGSGSGGAGGAGSAGGEFSLTVGGTVGSGGGGGGTGQITSGSSPAAGNGGLYGGGGAGGGGEGTATMFGTGGGGLIVITYTTGGLGPQNITASEGNLGYTVKYSPTAFTVSGAEGTVTGDITLALSGQTITINEGIVLYGSLLSGQTITSSEGSITAFVQGDVTLAISGQSAGFSQGQLFDNIGYLLDQSGVILVGQTAVFQEGFITPERDVALTGFTLPSTEGILTGNTSVGLTALTIVSVEGFVTATAGSNQSLVLGNLFINSVLGVPSVELDYFPSAFSPAFTLGTITFSEQAGSFLLGAQTIAATPGVITVTGPAVGTGPPLFIPPQLGKPVTTRTFSWADMAQRAWGSEFRAPDHRIYQFSGGNYKDSTDLGTTGIYSPNLGTPDNPPPKP